MGENPCEHRKCCLTVVPRSPGTMRGTFVPTSSEQIAGLWPDIAFRFIGRFAQIEKRLKDAGQIQRGRKAAQADWPTLADSLGQHFFDEVRQSGQADALINEPPRTRMADGLVFSPEMPLPLRNVRELFALGVCRVRNNLVHGEKFVVSEGGWERDEALVRAAQWILELAAERLTAQSAARKANR